jgi:hypothetical protein
VVNYGYAENNAEGDLDGISWLDIIWISHNILDILVLYLLWKCHQRNPDSLKIFTDILSYPYISNPIPRYPKGKLPDDIGRASQHNN